jgi:hypothetical protein
MASNEKNRRNSRTCDLTVTNRKDNRFGRVITGKSLQTLFS